MTSMEVQYSQKKGSFKLETRQKFVFYFWSFKSSSSLADADLRLFSSDSKNYKSKETTVFKLY